MFASTTITALAGLTSTSTTAGTLSNFTINSSGLYLSFNYKITITSVNTTSASFTISDTTTGAIISTSNSNIIISQCTPSPLIILNAEYIYCTWVGSSLTFSTTTALSGLIASSITDGTLNVFSIDPTGYFVKFSFTLSTVSTTPTTVSFTISDAITGATVSMNSSITVGFLISLSPAYATFGVVYATASFTIDVTSLEDPLTFELTNSATVIGTNLTFVAKTAYFQFLVSVEGNYDLSITSTSNPYILISLTTNSSGFLHPLIVITGTIHPSCWNPTNSITNAEFQTSEVAPIQSMSLFNEAYSYSNTISVTTSTVNGFGVGYITNFSGLNVGTYKLNIVIVSTKTYSITISTTMTVNYLVSSPTTPVYISATANLSVSLMLGCPLVSASVVIRGVAASGCSPLNSATTLTGCTTGTPTISTTLVVSGKSDGYAISETRQLDLHISTVSPVSLNQNCL